MQEMTNEEFIEKYKALKSKWTELKITNWGNITHEQFKEAVRDKTEDQREAEELHKQIVAHNKKVKDDSKLDYIGPQIVWSPFLFTNPAVFRYHDIVDIILDKRANTPSAIFDWMELIKSPECPSKYISEFYYSRYNNGSRIAIQMLEMISEHVNTPEPLKTEIKKAMNNRTTNLVSDAIVDDVSLLFSCLIVILGFFTIFAIVGVNSHPFFVVALYLAFYLLVSIAFHPVIKWITRESLEKCWSTALSAFETLRKNGHR